MKSPGLRIQTDNLEGKKTGSGKKLTQRNSKCLENQERNSQEISKTQKKESKDLKHSTSSIVYIRKKSESRMEDSPDGLNLLEKNEQNGRSSYREEETPATQCLHEEQKSLPSSGSQKQLNTKLNSNACKTNNQSQGRKNSAKIVSNTSKSKKWNNVTYVQKQKTIECVDLEKYKDDYKVELEAERESRKKEKIQDSEKKKEKSKNKNIKRKNKKKDKKDVLRYTLSMQEIHSSNLNTQFKHNQQTFALPKNMCSPFIFVENIPLPTFLLRDQK